MTIVTLSSVLWNLTYVEMKADIFITTVKNVVVNY